MNKDEAYGEGYNAGLWRKEHDDYDPRFDFAEAAKAGKAEFAEFKRGFEDAFNGREATP